MLLRGPLRTVPAVSIGAVLRIVISVLQSTNVAKVQASLPPGAEDEIILIEHLPGRRVHLQDFFWTGADDAPPWVDPNQGLTIYETRTVHHTVTGYPGEGTPQRPGPRDPECKTCMEPTPRLDDEDDENIGILVGEDPGPRYWLLTVLRPGEAVPPKVELRLARLYRAAFSRQQQRHLGLLSTDPRSRRAAKERAFHQRKMAMVFNRENKLDAENTTTSTLESTASDVQNSTDSAKIKTIKMIEVPKLKKTLPLDFDIDTSGSSEESSILKAILDRNTLKARKAKETKAKVETSQLSSTTESIQRNNSISNSNSSTASNRQNESVSMRQKAPEELQVLEPETPSNTSSAVSNVRHTSNNRPTKSASFQSKGNSENEAVRSRLRSLDRSVQGLVQVMMQNTSVIEGGATRLIYSVHLGGKPVPAETAARDMALLSPQEVALELGAPVIIQSEPYLKETRPLALSRKRDAWLLIGAAGAAIILLAIIVAGLVLAAKRKRAHSAVAAPPSRSILKKEREYVTATPGLDNAGFSTSETDAKTDGTSQRQTPRSFSRTPVTPATPDSLHEVSTDEEEEAKRRTRGSSPWEVQEQPPKKRRVSHARMTRTNAIDPPRTPDSMDTVDDHMETLESIENGYVKEEEATASPHSYLSMPSCKQFPSMRIVEPLSRVLEPVMVKHLDIDSPELTRRDNADVPAHRRNRVEERFLARTSSAIKDPGVVGPIVWSLRKQGMSLEGTGTSETDIDPISMVPAGPVGRARRRLHELLEDSFSLFGSREPKIRDPQAETTGRPASAAPPPDTLTIFSETRGRSANVSPVATPTSDLRARPHTSVPRKLGEEDIPETGRSGPAQPRGAWGSRPFSAGPFHRPNLPEVDVRRILTEAELPPEDPAVPLIASIKKELEKFSPR